MKKCIINFAKDGREQYEKGQQRLAQSIKDIGENCDTFFWNEFQPDWPSHSERSHGFKMNCFDHVFNQGYELVLWLDASAVVKAPLDYIWNEIEKSGYFFVDNEGCPMARWASEKQIISMGGTLSDAEKYCQCRSGIVGVNKKNRKWVDWGLKLPNISFNGDKQSSSKLYIDDRHDQAVWSYLIYRDKLYKHPGAIARYSGEGSDMEIIEFRGMSFPIEQV